MKKLIPILFKVLSFISPLLAAKFALKLFMHPRRKKRSDEEMEYLETGKQVTFTSKRKARTWGEGSVVWLIHGWESRGSTFYKLIPLLIEKGYKVIAWDGPAHGDSPGNSSHVVKNAYALAADLNESLFEKPIAILGHSFGGATLAVLFKIYAMPNKVIICSAPTRIKNVFSNFAKTIKLNDKATAKFFELAESGSKYLLDDSSLVNNDISVDHDVLIIHDKKDTVIPFSDFQVLKETWQSGQFIETENLDHRLTIKDEEMLKTIVKFISSQKSYRPHHLDLG